MARQKQNLRKQKPVKSEDKHIPGTPFHIYKQERMAANPKLEKHTIKKEWQKMTDTQINKYKNKLEALKAAAVSSSHQQAGAQVETADANDEIVTTESLTEESVEVAEDDNTLADKTE